MLVADLLRRNVRNRPQKEVIYCKPCKLRITYEEMNGRVNRLVDMLLKEGLGKGERVGVISGNCHIHPELLMASAKGGWVYVGIDHRLKAKEIEYIVRDSELGILFVGEGLTDLVRAPSKPLSTLKTVFFPADYERLIASFSDREPSVHVDDDDKITIAYTSGTTGDPKGVVHTNKTLIAGVTNMALTLSVSENDRALHTSPFSHIAPIWPFLLHCYYGGSNVIVSNLDAAYILKTIEEDKITTWNTVPIAIGRIGDLRGKEKFDISSLRWITYGASPMPLQVLKEALRYFGFILNQVYGTTETYIITVLGARDHILGESEEGVNRLASCGLEVINTETIVVGKDGMRIKPGETGEIITRGDHVCGGYWRDKEETERALRGGWFFTGDLATVDEKGYVYILGRRKEIIISGGENVSPKEVENVLYAHGLVKEVAVVGLPDVRWGEAVTAFIILREGQIVSEDEVIAFCRKRLAGYKCPKKVIFLKNFPATTSGKILKRRLREDYANKVC